MAAIARPAATLRLCHTAMTLATRIFASLAFAGSATVLIATTWLPLEGSLRRGEATLAGIVAQSNTWHEVQLITTDGIRLACRGRHGWPLLGPDRCPLDKFGRATGQTLSVLHDGKRPLAVTAGKDVIVDLAAQQKARLVAFAIALMLLLMAALVWRKPAGSGSLG